MAVGAEHLAIALRGARAMFTTRRGGFSSGPFESLNLGLLTDDNPADVRRNRRRLEDLVGEPLTMIHQVHGSRLHRVGRPAQPEEALVQADGQLTTVRGLAPMVLVADCLPVVVAGDGGVALIHAGWRGLAAGILEQAINALRQTGIDGPLEAAIGPGIGVCCYEVGEEVHEAFASYGDGVRRGRNLDLHHVARRQLDDAGATVAHEVGLCTSCHPELFFSHRRDHGITGRQAGVAWLT